jgi:hypothetical protein
VIKGRMQNEGSFISCLNMYLKTQEGFLCIGQELLRNHLVFVPVDFE